MNKIAFFIFLMAASPLAFSAPAFLLVSVEEVEIADYQPYREEQSFESGVPMMFSSWYIYKAKVKKVLLGSFKEKKVVFATFGHGIPEKEFLREYYVLVDEFEDKNLQSKLGVSLVAKDRGIKETVICMKEQNLSPFSGNPKVIEHSPGCYYLEGLLNEDT